MDDVVAWLRGELAADQAEYRQRDNLAYPGDWSFLLADVEAKRAILDLHGPIWRDVAFNATDEDGTFDTEQELEVCVICVPRHSWYPTRDAVPGYPCRTVRLLASAYRDRPGYQEAWRPDGVSRT